MKLKLALEDKQFDLRILDRLQAEGKVTKAQVDEYLKNLPDDEANCVKVPDGSEVASSSEL